MYFLNYFKNKERIRKRKKRRKVEEVEMDLPLVWNKGQSGVRAACRHVEL
jgi:hypothetical protein